jgi:hypothetical protein
MKALASTLAGALLLAMALAAFAPASIVDVRLDRMSGGLARIAEAGGTLWRGRGELTDGRGGTRIPLRWRLDPSSPLRGEADVVLAPVQASSFVRGRVQLSAQRVVATNVDIAVPATMIAAWAGAADAGVGGEVSIASEMLTLEPGRADGTLHLQWRRARFLAPAAPAIDLGIATARLVASGPGLSGPLEARGGEVLATGTLSITSRSLALDVELVPAPGAPRAIVDALARAGTPDARGAVRLRLSRELR